MAIIYAMYILLLLYTAYKDYKTFKINDSVNMGILFLSLLSDITGFPFKMLGAFLLTVPFLYLAVKTDGLGGGDIKFIFANGCMIGFCRSYRAVLIAFLLVTVVGTVTRTFGKATEKTALAPYLVTGYFIALLC